MKIDAKRAKAIGDGADKANLAYAHSLKGVTHPDKLEDFRKFAHASLSDVLDFLDDREELLGALREYGKHDKLCSVVGGYEYPCTCGLSKFLEGEEKNG